MAAKTIDLNAAIERVGVTRLAIFTVALCVVMMLTDGYDFAALSIAAPAILRDWKIEPKAMGLVFSVTYFGLMAGSIFYGWIADRFGRRFTIIFGTLNFGIPTLLNIWATNSTELMVLRFVAGLGMGGVVPIAYTLVSEYAPRRMRSTLTVITNAGYGIGASLTGVIAVVSIPAYGWQSLFFIGGLFSLAMAAALIFWLPESPHFLALKRPDSPKLRALAQKLMPREDIPLTARFTTLDPQDQGNEAGASIRNLFSGARASATSLLWALFFFDAVGFFFLASWLPVVMEGAGVSRGTASLTASLFTFTGMLGGFLIMRFLDRIGPMAVIVLPILGGPAEILVGAGLPQAAMLTFVGLAGVCLGGIHYAVYAIAVRYYPPTLRGRGVSAATVWGRAGGIVAPYIGGYLLSAHMPIQQLMIIAAIPCIATAIVGFALGRVYRHFDADAASAPSGALGKA